MNLEVFPLILFLGMPIFRLRTSLPGPTSSDRPLRCHPLLLFFTCFMRIMQLFHRVLKWPKFIGGVKAPKAAHLLQSGTEFVYGTFNAM